MRRPSRSGSALEVFLVFLRLGLTSFGGPIAHIGYYHKEFVNSRKWLSEGQFADLVALCQFLPGPSSSQTGFGIGLYRAGLSGAFAAFLGFTLPSALIMAFAGLMALSLSDPTYVGLFHGLKLVAMAVIAQALWTMYHALCPDRGRSLIALCALILMALVPQIFAMAAAIALGALMGLALKAPMPVHDQATSRPIALPKSLAIACLILAPLLLILLPLTRPFGEEFALFDSFYRAGALVFGGGHVVLPLLEGEFLAQGKLSADVFLAGYGLAQAMPGPLFTISAYLGAILGGPWMALLALIAMFSSGFLLLLGLLPFWTKWQDNQNLRRAMRGSNAAVVGILAAVFFTAMLGQKGLTLIDLAIALALWSGLSQWHLPLWLIVLMGAVLGWAQSLI